MAEKVYKVSNAGTQAVNGPHVNRPEAKNNVKTGSDLRVGKGK